MIAGKKTLTGALAALTVASGLMGAAQPAAAWGRGGWGGPVAAGVIGGLAAGAIIGSAASHPAYGYGGYGYGGYAYGGYGPEPVYDPCYVARRPLYDAYGNFAGYHHVRVCN